MSSNFQWVRVSHRLPPEHTEVLVIAKHWRGIFDVFYSDGKWWKDSDKEAEFFDEVWSWAEFNGECECERSELDWFAQLVAENPNLFGFYYNPTMDKARLWAKKGKYPEHNRESNLADAIAYLEQPQPPRAKDLRSQWVIARNQIRGEIPEQTQIFNDMFRRFMEAQDD